MAPILMALALALSVQPETRQDPAYQDPVQLAAHATRLAAQAQSLGPGSDEGRRYAAKAALWCIYAHAALCFREAPDDGGVQAVRGAAERCAEVIPDKLGVEEVRGYRQSDIRYCVLASVRMLLSRWRIAASEEDLRALAGDRLTETGLNVGFVLDALPGYGVSVLACEGDTTLVRIALAAGFPVGVYQWVRRDREVPHMRVVIGCDRDKTTGNWVWDMLDPAPEMPARWRAPDEEFQALWACRWDDQGHLHWMCVPYMAHRTH